MRRTKTLLSTLAIALLLPLLARAQVRTDRLDRLAARLDTVAPKNFDIMCWGTTPNPDDPNYVGCAAGHAVAVFKADGFHYGLLPGGAVFPAYTDAKGVEWENHEAIEHFFGISTKEMSILFGPRGHAGRDPAKAAANLREISLSHKLAGTVRLAYFTVQLNE